MQDQPLVSVLMPVYNCENYILEAVESILQQTYSNFELLIIDDCSTDTTVYKIKSLNDNRIQLILKPKNSGYTNSLNYGLEIAKGKYIYMSDLDGTYKFSFIHTFPKLSFANNVQCRSKSDHE